MELLIAVLLVAIFGVLAQVREPTLATPTRGPPSSAW